MIQGTVKKKQTHYKNDNVLEAIGSIPTNVGSNAVSEVGKISQDILTSLIGGVPREGNLEPNQVIELSPTSAVETQKETPKQVEMPVRPDIDAIEQETRQQVEAIRMELKALIASLKNLHQEVQTAVSSEVANPGIYHVNYYEQLRIFIQVLRQQVEDSRTWLAAFSVRKKKMGYWGMFKKHGTSFGLSNERSLATAAG